MRLVLAAANRWPPWLKAHCREEIADIYTQCAIYQTKMFGIEKALLV